MRIKLFAFCMFFLMVIGGFGVSATEISPNRLASDSSAEQLVRNEIRKVYDGTAQLEDLDGKNRTEELLMRYPKMAGLKMSFFDYLYDNQFQIVELETEEEKEALMTKGYYLSSLGTSNYNKTITSVTYTKASELLDYPVKVTIKYSLSGQVRYDLSTKKIVYYSGPRETFISSDKLIEGFNGSCQVFYTPGNYGIKIQSRIYFDYLYDSLTAVNIPCNPVTSTYTHYPLAQ